jgi:hypothetical protein
VLSGQTSAQDGLAGLQKTLEPILASEQKSS